MQHTENERTVFNLNPKAFRGGDSGEVIPAGTFHDQAPDKFRGGDPGEVIPAGTFHDQAPATSQGDSEGGE